VEGLLALLGKMESFVIDFLHPQSVASVVVFQIELIQGFWIESLFGNLFDQTKIYFVQLFLEVE